MQGAGGVGGLLEVSYYGNATTNCFPAFDGNGNVIALINAADGTVVANYDYGPFGEPIRITGAMANNNPFLFSTKYYDAESGLYYYGHRYYKPSTGTWPNRDPMGDESFDEDNSVVNDAKITELTRIALQLPYCFVGNSPIAKCDLLGLAPLFLQTCSAEDSGSGYPDPGSSLHHINRRRYPGHSLTFRLCCPSCNSYLTTYGVTANPVPRSFHGVDPIFMPQRIFPSDWTTITVTHSLDVSSGGTCYDIKINVPTRNWDDDYASLQNVHVIGICCIIPSNLERLDPPVPPDWFMPTVGPAPTPTYP